MLTRLRVQNFKCFEDSGDLQIRPLTLLVGPNSGGKSTLLQALLLLRQTIASPDPTTPLALEGEWVRLGSYPAVAFRQEWKRPLGFEFEFGARLPTFRVGRERPRQPTVEQVSVRLTFKYGLKTMRVSLEEARYAVPSVGALSIRPTARSGYARCTLTWDDQSAHYESALTRFMCLAPSLPSRKSRQGLEQEMERFLRATLLGSQTEQFFRRLFYLGPLREWPQRAYVASGQSPADVGFKGESSVDVMWVRARHKKTREPLEAHMNRWIEKFGIGQGLRLKRLGGNLYSVVLTGQKAGVDVNLADVGFGASQVLPIIVEVFHAPEDSALLIEQPEIHLHPAAQLTLGDLLVDGAGRGLTLLVETHSEHLISRVQRRIAEGAISENDVALYYVQPDLMGAQAKRIEIDRRGQLVEGTVPNGFFEEGFGETLEHARVLANR